MIRLIKKNKKSGKTSCIEYETYADLEKKLSKISSSFYKISDFTIEADNFEKLVETFTTYYLEEYYTIDYDLEVISIHKVEVGKRRLKETTTFKPKYRKIQDLIRKNSKEAVSFDKDFKIFYTKMNNQDIEFVCSGENEDLQISEVIINGVFYNDILSLIKKIKNVKKRAKYL